MNKPPKPQSKTGTIRLSADHFVKLRELMKLNHGRTWLEKVIDREHKKANKQVWP